MKKLLVPVLMLTMLAFKPKQQTGDLTEIPAGSQLAYNVDFKGQKYQFVVDVVKKSPELVFKYNLTMGGGMQGTISISEASMKSAINQQNYFNGTDKNLTDETTVWVSNKVYKEIKATGKTNIGNAQGGLAGFKSEQYSLVGTEDYTTALNGETLVLKALHIKSTEGSNFEYWIWDNEKDPLILKMDLGWGISLKELSIN